MANNNEYMRIYMNKRYHKRRQEALEILGGRCAQCDSTQNLEIDHIKPENKKIEIGKNLNGNKELIFNELKVCQLLCNSCHVEKSATEKSAEHGGGLSGKKNCKCLPCKTAKNLYMLHWKRARALAKKQAKQ